jgi:hypothetical protein
MTRQYALQDQIRQYEYRVVNASALLKREIGLAGYMGCPQLQDGFPIATEEQIDFSAASKLTGTADQFTVKHAAFPPASVLDVSSDRATVKTDLGQRFKSGQLVIIVDCRHAEIKRIAHASRADPFQFLSFERPLSSTFDTSAEMSPLAIDRYYIADHSLMMQGSNGRDAILMEGIEAMNLTYHHASQKLIGVTIKLQARQGKQLKNWYSYAPVL